MTFICESGYCGYATTGTHAAIVLLGNLETTGPAKATCYLCRGPIDSNAPRVRGFKRLQVSSIVPNRLID